MSVIAKMSVFNVRDFGTNQLVELNTVCADELMPGCNENAKQNENFTFQMASPSGDAKLTLDKDIKFRTGEELYLIFHHTKEVPAFHDALAVVEARCAAITTYGGTSKKVEVAGAAQYDYDGRKYTFKHEKQIQHFNMYITIDNPEASIQFEAGQGDYWIGIYRASELSMTKALARARGYDG